MANFVALNALIPEELKEGFEIARIRRKKTQKEAAAEAVQLWISGPSQAESVDFGPMTGEESTMIKALLALSRSEDEDMKGILRALLRPWADRFKPLSPTRKRQA